MSKLKACEEKLVSLMGGKQTLNFVMKVKSLSTCHRGGQECDYVALASGGSQVKLICSMVCSSKFKRLVLLLFVDVVARGVSNGRSNVSIKLARGPNSSPSRLAEVTARQNSW